MPKTVLCVDDDRQIFGELEAHLEDGEVLIHTDNLAEAFSIAVEERPDLILLEIELRDGNGLDLAERIRNEAGPISGVPILIVTRCGRTPGLYGRAVQLGTIDYLMKPVLPSQLITCVEESLDLKKQTPANRPQAIETGLGSGRLRDLPLPELLDRVYRRGESGVLIVGNARARTGIQIRNGSPAAVTLSPSERFADFLVRTERVAEDDLQRADGRMEGGFTNAEDLLLEMGAIDAAGLEEAQQERAREEIFKLFELTQGRFRFEPGRRLKGARSLDITSSAQSLIVRGVLAWSSLEAVRAALARYGDLHPVGGKICEPDFDDVPFSDAQRAFVAGLASDRRVDEFLDGSEFELRTLYAFAILGVIDLCPDPMLVLDDVLNEAPASGPLPHEVEPSASRPPDLNFEDDLFDGELAAPLFADQPAPDRSYEDDLFEQRIFDEDSFEGEMVEAQRAPAEAEQPESTVGEISELLAQVTEADLIPHPESFSEPEPERGAGPESEPLPASPPEAALEAPSSASVLPKARKRRRPKKKSKARKPKRREQLPAPKLEPESEPAPTPEIEPEAMLEQASTDAPSLPEPLTQKPAEPAPPTVAEAPDGSRHHEIAPHWSVRADAHERLDLARRIQNGLDRRYGLLTERDAEATAADGREQSTSEGSAARALEAESWFHRGREHLKSKRIDKAVEAFGMAAHLEPAEGEYVAHLGYALYVARPDDEMVRKEALEHIARGIKLSPDREISYVFLGRIFKVTGDVTIARKMFTRALQIRPHCHEAAAELRLIEARERKKSGLLGRFRR